MHWLLICDNAQQFAEVSGVKDASATAEPSSKFSNGRTTFDNAKSNLLSGGGKKAACEKVGLNYETSKQFGWVCQTYKVSARADNCTFRHHQVIAALPEPARRSD